MTSKLRIYGIFILIGLAASCSRVPKDIISEKKMRAMLYDMQIAEALVESSNEQFGTSDKRQVVYDAVFAKHDVTQARYDSSLIWYGKNLDLYMGVYRLVLKDVNESIAALGDIKPHPLSADVANKDSVDVWIFNRNYTFKPENVFNTLTYDILPQVPHSSGSSYVLGLSAWGISANMKHKPKIHISAVHADTIVSVNKELSEDGYHEIILRTIATKQVKRVYGYMTINNADASYHRVYFNEINMMKYNYGSKALTDMQTDSLSIGNTELDAESLMMTPPPGVD